MSEEKPVKLGVWVLPSEREALYERTRDLGFSNFSELIRALADLRPDDNDRLETLRLLLNPSPDELLEDDERMLVIVADEGIYKKLEDQARANDAGTPTQYAAELIIRGVEEEPRVIDVRKNLTDMQNTVRSLVAATLALQERATFLERISSGDREVVEHSARPDIVVSQAVAKATAELLKDWPEASEALKTVLAACELRYPDTPKEPGFFVGRPKGEDVEVVLRSVHKQVDALSPSKIIARVGALTIRSVWERAYSKLFAKGPGLL